MSLTEKLREFLATTKTDFPASLQMLTEDVVWINKLPGHAPFGGEYRGREQVARYFQLLGETFILGEHPLSEYDIIEGANALVVVGCEKGGKVISTGKVIDLEFVWVVRFDSRQRISYLREHNDTATLGDAFYPEPQVATGR